MAKDFIVKKRDTIVVCLSERDVPGAALNGRDPTCLMIPQLKHWQCCNVRMHY